MSYSVVKEVIYEIIIIIRIEVGYFKNITNYNVKIILYMIKSYNHISITY